MKIAYRASRIWLCVGLLFVTLAACKSNSAIKEVEKLYAQFMDSDIVISPNLVYGGAKSGISRADVLKSEYQLIVYHSEDNCTDCSLRALLQWQNYMKELPKGVLVILIFRSQDYQSIERNLKMYNIEYPYFIDMDGRFESDNPSMPPQLPFHTFMLKHGKVWLIGSPVENEKVRRVYEKALKAI